ncbi:hypothetical protein EAH88_06305 [Rhodanobacter glycinis]|uniref:Uncharacterized protein n=1 Tax=Rhodanobacter glycinis TaxID=582702 RepID=A0A502CCG4_9GAMM|nr:hypothetical protein EAH88_06305 [Rhodanobacter glycinis]
MWRLVLPAPPLLAPVAPDSCSVPLIPGGSSTPISSITYNGFFANLPLPVVKSVAPATPM